MAKTLAQQMQGWPFFRGVRFAEWVPDSPKEKFQMDGSQAVRTLLTPWETRHDFVRQWLGFAEVKVAGGAKYIARVTPASHPDFLREEDGRPWLFCTDVQFEPWTLPDRENNRAALRSVRDTAVYGLAKATCTYSDLPWDVMEDAEIKNGDTPDEALLKRYVTIEVRPSGQSITYPINTLFYVDTGTPPFTGQAQTMLPKFDFSVTHHHVPQGAVGSRLVNPNAPSWPIDDAMGCINLTAFPPRAAKQCPQGTLLYASCSMKPRKATNGYRVYDITHNFRWVGDRGDAAGGKITWTHFPQPRTNPLRWYEVSTNGTTNIVAAPTTDKSLYNFAEFADLFRPVWDLVAGA